MLKIVQTGKHWHHIRTVQAINQLQTQKTLTSEPSNISTNENLSYARRLKHSLVSQQILTNEKAAFKGFHDCVGYLQSREITTESVRTEMEGKLANANIPGPNFGLTFDDFRTAFSHKSRWELIRALSVLWVCSFDFVANHSLKMMSTSRKLLGQKASQWLLKRLVYEQFVAGETTEEIRAVVEQMQKIHVGPLLAAPMEDDINVFHQDADKVCDANLEMMLKGMELALALDPQFPMVQIRFSALMPGDFCLFPTEYTQKTHDIGSILLEYSSKAYLSEKCPQPSKTPDVIEALASALTGHPLDVERTFGSGFSDSMRHHLEQGIARVAQICKRAVSQEVIVMADAEYTYMNPALSLFALAMMCVCNDTARGPPLVFHTYQNYLKGTRERMERDSQFAETRGIGFGVKLVRGAYMHRERRLAASLGHPDPVQDTYDDTSRAYDEAVTTMLRKIAARPRQYRAIVASHNEKSILAAIKGIQQLDIDPRGGSVFFGQLMGMADHVSCNLALNGFLARKSLPYGRLDDTLPYLSRRAQENRAVFNGVRRERNLLRSELRHRFRLRAA